MIKWIGEDLSPNKDKGITRDLIKAGEGYLMPTQGGLVDGKLKLYFSIYLLIYLNVIWFLNKDKYNIRWLHWWQYIQGIDPVKNCTK